MKVGVFDSGIGGLSVARAIQKALPEDEIVYVNDKANVPYGDKTPIELLGLVQPILQTLVDQGCKVIVIACNSVTTTLIPKLRERLDVPLVGMEPMVKPAAEQSRTNVIAICATPVTLASSRYKWLKETYAPGVKILEPDCADWARMIEHDAIDRQKIAVEVEGMLAENVDVIVLGCTHYHWIEAEIKQVANGRAKILQPEQPVIAELKRVIARLA